MQSKLLQIIDFWQQQLWKPKIHREKLADIPQYPQEVIDILGVRRCGKSSLFSLFVQQYSIGTNEALLINFEDPFFIEHNTPHIIEGLVEAFEANFSSQLKYLFFDEIQAIDKWEHAIQKLLSSQKYHIFVTGSSSKMLSTELSTLLTGRHRSQSLFPLSFSEFLRFQNVEISAPKDIALQEQKIKTLFEQYMKLGGFPQAVLQNESSLLKSYFLDIVQRDIIFRYDIRQKGILERMAVYLLTNAAKIYSLTTLQKMFGISPQLAKNYVAYLKEAFLLMDLQKFSYSLKRQHLSAKKIYAIDTGLAGAVSFEFSENRGRKLENMVFLHLRRSDKNIFYHKEQYECDFVVQDRNTINNAVQVCAQLTLENRKREIRGLQEACQIHGLSEGTIITLDQEERFEHQGITISVVPAWKYFLSAYA